MSPDERAELIEVAAAMLRGELTCEKGHRAGERGVHVHFDDVHRWGQRIARVAHGAGRSSDPEPAPPVDNQHPLIRGIADLPQQAGEPGTDYIKRGGALAVAIDYLRRAVPALQATPDPLSGTYVGPVCHEDYPHTTSHVHDFRGSPPHCTYPGCGAVPALQATPEPAPLEWLEAQIRAWHDSSEPARSLAERIAATFGEPPACRHCMDQGHVEQSRGAVPALQATGEPTDE